LSPYLNEYRKVNLLRRALIKKYNLTYKEAAIMLMSKDEQPNVKKLCHDVLWKPGERIPKGEKQVATLYLEDGRVHTNIRPKDMRHFVAEDIRGLFGDDYRIMTTKPLQYELVMPNRPSAGSLVFIMLNKPDERRFNLKATSIAKKHGIDMDLKGPVLIGKALTSLVII